MADGINMKKALKISLILFTFIFSVLLLLLLLINCGAASKIAELVIASKTDCKVEIAGFHISPLKSFPMIDVYADSVSLENRKTSLSATAYRPSISCMIRKKNLKTNASLDSISLSALDSVDLRVRGAEIKILAKKDSLFAEGSLKNNFIRYGSSRCILNNIGLSGIIKKRIGADRLVLADLEIDESKVISTMFPLLTRIRKVSISLDNDDFFLNEISLKSGTTDISICGNGSNLTEFLDNKGCLEMNLEINSDNINVNEILSGILYGKYDRKKYYSPSEEENEDFIVVDKYVEYPFKIEKIIPLLIPEWLKISAELHIGKGRVSVFKMYNTSAHLEVMDKIAKFSDCKMGSNFGNIDATLFYASESKENLLAGVDMQLKKLTVKNIVDIMPKTDNLTPMLKSFKGEFNCRATIITQVDTALIPIPRTMKGVINVSGRNMCITDAGGLRKYTSLLMFRDKNIGKIDDINLYGIISDNKIKVFPMLLGVDRFILAMSGTHNFNNVFDYDISVIKSPVPFKFGFNLRNKGKKSKVKFKFTNPQFLDANLPTNYKEVAATHKQLSSSIQNVLKDGVIVTRANSSRITEELFNKHKELKQTEINLEEKESVEDSVKLYYKELEKLFSSKEE